jgi:hypothetical protein
VSCCAPTRQTTLTTWSPSRLVAAWSYRGGDGIASNSTNHRELLVVTVRSGSQLEPV